MPLSRRNFLAISAAVASNPALGILPATADESRNPSVPALFRRWLANHFDRFSIPLRELNVRGEEWIAGFQGIDPRLVCRVGAGSIEVGAWQENGQWRAAIHLRPVPAFHPTRGWYCSACAAPEVFSSLEELWAGHAFEALLDWVNFELVSSEILALGFPPLAPPTCLLMTRNVYEQDIAACCDPASARQRFPATELRALPWPLGSPSALFRNAEDLLTSGYGMPWLHRGYDPYPAFVDWASHHRECLPLEPCVRQRSIGPALFRLKNLPFLGIWLDDCALSVQHVIDDKLLQGGFCALVLARHDLTHGWYNAGNDSRQHFDSAAQLWEENAFSPFRKWLGGLTAVPPIRA